MNEEFSRWLEINYPSHPIDSPYWATAGGQVALEQLYQYWQANHTDTAWTDEQLAEYQAYLDFLATAQGRGFPVPADIDDYFENRDTWQTEMGETTGWTADQKWAYDRYQDYAKQYGDPSDWYPTDIKDYFDNKDVAEEQLYEWQQAASVDYQRYRDFLNQRDPGEYYYPSLDDFVSNYDQAMQQIGQWEGLWQEDEAKRELQEQRYEESMAERYRPEVQYNPAFYQKMEAIQGESVYYEDWMKRLYPELRQRFEATQPRPVGYPSLGEAREAAEQTEKDWGGWLQQQDLKQEFYGQAPYMRGERPAVYAPRLRQVAYG